MKFASIIKAEEGWRVVMAREDGEPVYIPISYWGIVAETASYRPIENQDQRFVIPTKWAPLDDMQDQLSNKAPFVMILYPNEEEIIPARINDVRNRCVAKAKMLKTAVKSDT